ncbi:pyridoxamine 5'-phosphate oxidase family protein [Halorarius litoreus]|uniref:pyridoxamine 5'-phosphate oxidase family protein n=1 Tax=Halorarius litoreus TaxID=2962676 RepID=UPI0020CDCDFA|nr:pyridoxamine 5'-phosphate oxidase family protein [Halorarius litoreus]
MPVPPEVEALITDAPVSAHLATSVDDRPHVAPVWYGYRDGTVYFATGGRKLANVRRNPRVALSIESARGGDVDWNVTLLGHATVVEDPDRVAWAESWIYDRYDGAATDGGESETDDSGRDYELLAVTVGSVAWNVYA